MKYEDYMKKLEEEIAIFQKQRSGAKGTFRAQNYGTLCGMMWARELAEDLEFTDMKHYSDGDMKVEYSHGKYHITNISPATMEWIIYIMQSCNSNEDLTNCKEKEKIIGSFKQLEITTENIQ